MHIFRNGVVGEIRSRKLLDLTHNGGEVLLEVVRARVDLGAIDSQAVLLRVDGVLKLDCRDDIHANVKQLLLHELIGKRLDDRGLKHLFCGQRLSCEGRLVHYFLVLVFILPEHGIEEGLLYGVGKCGIEAGYTAFKLIVHPPLAYGVAADVHVGELYPGLFLLEDLSFLPPVKQYLLKVVEEVLIDADEYVDALNNGVVYLRLEEKPVELVDMLNEGVGVLDDGAYKLVVGGGVYANTAEPAGTGNRQSGGRILMIRILFAVFALFPVIILGEDGLLILEVADLGFE